MVTNCKVVRIKSHTDLEIRPASALDIFDLALQLDRSSNDSNRSTVYNFNLNTFLTNWVDWLRQPNYCLLTAFDDKHLLMGGIGGIIENGLHSNSPVGYEIFWYAREDCQPTVGEQLIQRFYDWVKASGGRHVILKCVYDDEKENHIERLKRMGFREFEILLVKEVE